MKILFVCTGNTCRSPMASAIAADIFGQSDCPAQFSSSGISALDGMPASKNSIAAAKEIGLDLTGHKSRILTPDMVGESDLILTMTESHRSFIINEYDNCEDKTYTLARYAKSSGDICDPYGQDLQAYRACRDQLYQLLGIICKRCLNDSYS